jgi:hypothetical protein
MSEDILRIKIRKGELSEIRHECVNAATDRKKRPFYLITAKGIEKLTGVRPSLGTSELVDEVAEALIGKLIPKIQIMMKEIKIDGTSPRRGGRNARS